MENNFKKMISDVVRKSMNESFSSWCDANVPKFDMIGFTTSMASFFDIFNNLFEADEVRNFKFLLYDESKHKELLFQYPDADVASNSEKVALYFSDLIKNKLSNRPDELAKYMKNTYMCIEINPDRYLYNYIMSFTDVSSSQKIYIDEDREYSCVVKNIESSGKVLLYITTESFMKDPDKYIEFFS